MSDVELLRDSIIDQLNDARWYATPDLIIYPPKFYHISIKYPNEIPTPVCGEVYDIRSVIEGKPLNDVHEIIIINDERLCYFSLCGLALSGFKCNVCEKCLHWLISNYKRLNIIEVIDTRKPN